MEEDMGDDAEYNMEQQELEKRDHDAQRQARIEEDARRNRKWEKAAHGAAEAARKPKDQ
jgi:hypothetical protein